MVIIKLLFKLSPFSGPIALVRVKTPASFEASSKQSREVVFA